MFVGSSSCFCKSPLAGYLGSKNTFANWIWIPSSASDSFAARAFSGSSKSTKPYPLHLPFSLSTIAFVETILPNRSHILCRSSSFVLKIFVLNCLLAVLKIGAELTRGSARSDLGGVTLHSSSKKAYLGTESSNVQICFGQLFVLAVMIVCRWSISFKTNVKMMITVISNQAIYTIFENHEFPLSCSLQ